jgi:hypothetical protein
MMRIQRPIRGPDDQLRDSARRIARLDGGLGANSFVRQTDSGMCGLDDIQTVVTMSLITNRRLGVECGANQALLRRTRLLRRSWTRGW